MVLVYFTDVELPNGKTVCRLVFPLLLDDIDRPAEFPTQIITKTADDGSDLARLAQYLAHPDPDNAEYGVLSKRARLVRKYGKYMVILSLEHSLIQPPAMQAAVLMLSCWGQNVDTFKSSTLVVQIWKNPRKSPKKCAYSGILCLYQIFPWQTNKILTIFYISS